MSRDNGRTESCGCLLAILLGVVAAIFGSGVLLGSILVRKGVM